MTQRWHKNDTRQLFRSAGSTLKLDFHCLIPSVMSPGWHRANDWFSMLSLSWAKTRNTTPICTTSSLRSSISLGETQLGSRIFRLLTPWVPYNIIRQWHPVSPHLGGQKSYSVCLCSWVFHQPILENCRDVMRHPVNDFFVTASLATIHPTAWLDHTSLGCRTALNALKGIRT